MVGFVIVSHSQTLADGVVELTKMMADGVPIRAAGGLEDGGFGTSYEKIANAIEEIYSDDGVIVLMDMGSAVMTAEMVLEATHAIVFCIIWPSNDAEKTGDEAVKGICGRCGRYGKQVCDCGSGNRG